jgi:hypothetical protein
VSRPRSRPGRRWGTITSSPRARGRLGFERGQLRRGRAARSGRRRKLLWLLGSRPGGLGALEKWRGGEFAGGRQWRARRRAVTARGRAWLGFYRRDPSGDVAVTTREAPGGLRGASGCGAWGGATLGRRRPWAARGADAEAGRRAAVDRGRARRHPGLNVLLVHCLSTFFSKNLNKS